MIQNAVFGETFYSLCDSTLSPRVSPWKPAHCLFCFVHSRCSLGLVQFVLVVFHQAYFTQALPPFSVYCYFISPHHFSLPVCVVVSISPGCSEFQHPLSIPIKTISAPSAVKTSKHGLQQIWFISKHPPKQKCLVYLKMSRQGFLCVWCMTN